MVESVYEPADLYSKEFRKKFSKIAQTTFEELFKTSGVNAKENKKIISSLTVLDLGLEEIDKRINSLYFWQAFFVILMIACSVGFIYFESQISKSTATTFVTLPLLFTVLCVLLFFASLIFIFKSIRPQIAAAQLEKESFISDYNEKKRIAWEQMEPLNRLFDWDITVRMISKTVPKISFDPYFTVGRLRELYEDFGWNDEFNENKSVLFAHSGEINGNPFILGRTLCMRWTTKIYTGTKRITYAVRRGKSSCLRTEILRANVMKSCPEYYTETFLIYGNDAAPNLVFYRASSGIANDEDSFIGKMKKKATLRELKKFSRNLKDASQYTMMNNSDFEVLFNTKNRNNEIEYRLLFTPLAQNQMVRLLRNSKDGYGDDFSFLKLKKVNLIHAKHLDNLELDTNPEQYHHYDLNRIKERFISQNTEYFRSIYFAFAPLLSIPLYQQIRSRNKIYKQRKNQKSCFWEHEALANFHGHQKFAAPDCATSCILKTEIIHDNHDQTNVRTIAVTAHGFSITEHVEYVRVRGGDGHYHAVPVHWDEYLPTEQTTLLQFEEDCTLFEKPDLSVKERYAYIQEKENTPLKPKFRRSILSYFD